MKNGSKISARRAAGTPGPSSAKRSSTCPSRCAPRMRSTPPGVAWDALRSRCETAAERARGSPCTRGSPARPSRLTCRGSPSSRAASTLSSTSATRSTSRRGPGGHEAERVRQLAHDVAGAPRLLQHLLALVRHDHGGGARAPRDVFELVLELADGGRHQRGESGEAARSLRLLGDGARVAPRAAVDVHLPAQAHGGGGGEEERAGRGGHASAAPDGGKDVPQAAGPGRSGPRRRRGARGTRSRRPPGRLPAAARRMAKGTNHARSAHPPGGRHFGRRGRWRRRAGCRRRGRTPRGRRRRAARRGDPLARQNTAAQTATTAHKAPIRIRCVAEGSSMLSEDVSTEPHEDVDDGGRDEDAVRRGRRGPSAARAGAPSGPGRRRSGPGSR